MRWRSCRDNPKYEASDSGLVRHVATRNILKPYRGKYCRTVSWRLPRGPVVNVGVSVLVAKAFLGPARRRVVVHTNHDTSDNRLANLAYVTWAEFYRTYSIPPVPPRGAAHPNNIHDWRTVCAIRKASRRGATQTDIGTRFGISQSWVSQIVRGRFRTTA